MPAPEAVCIALEAYAPEALAPPTSNVRWYLTGERTAMAELVAIEGEPSAVEAFVLAHWGDHVMDGYFSPDGFFADNTYVREEN